MGLRADAYDCQVAAVLQKATTCWSGAEPILRRSFFATGSWRERFKNTEAMKQQEGKLISWFRGNHRPNVVGKGCVCRENGLSGLRRMKQ